MNETLVRNYVKALARAHTATGAAKLLGISATSVARIAADLPVQRGTLALVEQRAREGVSAMAVTAAPLPTA